MDNVAFFYTREDPLVRCVDAGDYFDAEALYKKFLADGSNDNKFICIINTDDLALRDMKHVCEFLKLGMFPRYDLFTQEHYECIFKAMIGYSKKQKFWILFSNDEHALALEREIQGRP